MKKSMKFIAVAMVVLMLCMTLASCGKTLSGKYTAEVNYLVGKYKVTYSFSGSKVEVVKKNTLLGSSETKTIEGTYEIAEDEAGDLTITFEFETEDDVVKSNTYEFEELENGNIKIGTVEYEKLDD